jgi:hypothetical protein
LGAITSLAVLVHGYHLGVDHAAIYVPAIRRAADPKLQPFGAEFFVSHAHLSFFPPYPPSMTSPSAKAPGVMSSAILKRLCTRHST